MNAIQGYLEKLGGNFMIAAFIPFLPAWWRLARFSPLSLLSQCRLH